MKWFYIHAPLGEKNQQWPQIAAVLSASLLAVISGNHMAWPSPSVLKLLDNDMQFTITENEISLIVMVAPLGFLIGSPISAILLDKIGRKNTLLLLAIPHIVSWVLIATATSPTGLYIGRVISGISDGGIYTCLPIYNGEVLQPKVRGRYGVSHSAAILIGMLIINIYGSFTSIRSAAYISLAVPVLFLTTFIWMPESPYFLLGKGRTMDAEEALQRLRLKQDVKSELTQIQLDVQRQLAEPSSVKDIFKIASNLKAFLILFMLRTFQQFTAVTPVGNYMQVIFQQADTGLSAANSTLIVIASQIAFMIGGGRLLDKFGRRPLLIWSYFTTSAFLAILGMYFYLEGSGFNMDYLKWLPVVGMVLYSIVLATGALPIPNLMSGELLSAGIKSTALGLLNMYAGLAMGGTSKLFQWLDHDFGMHVPFFTFAVLCLLGTIFSYFCVPETKGKTLEEIQQAFKDNTKSSWQKSNSHVVTNSF